MREIGSASTLQDMLRRLTKAAYSNNPKIKVTDALPDLGHGFEVLIPHRDSSTLCISYEVRIIEKRELKVRPK